MVHVQCFLAVQESVKFQVSVFIGAWLKCFSRRALSIYSWQGFSFAAIKFSHCFLGHLAKLAPRKTFL